MGKINLCKFAVSCAVTLGILVAGWYSGVVLFDMLATAHTALSSMAWYNSTTIAVITVYALACVVAVYVWCVGAHIDTPVGEIDPRILGFLGLLPIFLGVGMVIIFLVIIVRDYIPIAIVVFGFVSGIIYQSRVVRICKK